MDSYTRLYRFLINNCPNKQCKDCDYRDKDKHKCRHPRRPRVRLLQHSMKWGG